MGGRDTREAFGFATAESPYDANPAKRRVTPPLGVHSGRFSAAIMTSGPSDRI
jgi:hypothetical protein